MSEFKLGLSEFEGIAGTMETISQNISDCVSSASDATESFVDSESGKWSNDFERFAKSLIENCIDALDEITSSYVEYYDSALVEANNLATNRDNLLEACGNSTSDSNIVYLTTGQHIPSKCSDAKESLTTLKINAQAVMYSDAWSSLKSNSTFYSTNVGTYRAKMSEYLNDLISDVDTQKTTLTQVSENYSTFKASVEDFEENYSGLFDAGLLQDTYESLVAANLGIGNDLLSIYKEDKKYEGGLAKLLLQIAVVANYSVGIDSQGWVSWDDFAAYLQCLPDDYKIKGLSSGDDIRNYISLFGNFDLKDTDSWSSFLKTLTANASLSEINVKSVLKGVGDSWKWTDTLSIVGKTAESWFSTDGDTSDKVSAAAGTAAWSAVSTVGKKAISTVTEKGCTYIGAAIGTAICPGLGTAVGAAVGKFVGSIAGDVAGDAIVTAIEENTEIDDWVQDSVGEVAENVWNGVTSFFSGS